MFCALNFTKTWFLCSILFKALKSVTHRCNSHVLVDLVDQLFVGHQPSVPGEVVSSSAFQPPFTTTHRPEGQLPHVAQDVLVKFWVDCAKAIVACRTTLYLVVTSITNWLYWGLKNGCSFSRSCFMRYQSNYFRLLAHLTKTQEIRNSRKNSYSSKNLLFQQFSGQQFKGIFLSILTTIYQIQK